MSANRSSPPQSGRPNILFIMSDDHASHAISAYGSRLNVTPHMDRLAAEGMRLENCFCTNSICSPSRASILTGTYSHVNGVLTLREGLDGRRSNVAKLLQAGGYQTAIVGKWHLGHGGVHDPTGFDYWNVLPGQGKYHDPELIELGERKTVRGYATDVITDLALDWLDRRDRQRPFCLLLHHKAPHRSWEPPARYASLYEEAELPYPPTFDDDYAGRAPAAAAATMRVEHDLDERDLKVPPPPGLSGPALKRWKYQRYIKDYLRCVASLDDNVGRVLEYLDAEGLAEDTVVIYTSDQGFFLGDHGWYDKRFFYEESLRMPFLVRYPREIPPASADQHIVLNVDFPSLFLDYAGLDSPAEMQGRSFRSILRGDPPTDWRRSMYYRYFMHRDPNHNVYAHYGIRTDRYKLIYYYETEPDPPAWELFDLQQDPAELNSVYHHPQYQDVVRDLKAELAALRAAVGDTTNPWPDPQ
ncbi:MAG TPA: sulfatase [Chloroflexota bacterium]|nr:sulfatase [Chloroflexota bacterium]